MSVTSADFTDIVMTATAEIIARAVATAEAANRLVWISELEPRADDRHRIRMILRNP